MDRTMWTDEQVKAMADAMWQLLDDMGTDGQSVSLSAKADARLALEPFMVTADDREACLGLMTIEDARRIAEVD